jgi:pimeloyl-ACP methyl ester carboxylesterase
VTLSSIFACLGATVAGFVLVASDAVAAEHRAGEIVVEQAAMTTSTGETVPYEIGTFYVPENRSAPDSRVIGVGFARIRSSGPAGAAPAFVLPGGPGDSYLGAFTGTNARSLGQQRQFLRYRTIGDVVIVDQRGYSRRGEQLRYGPPHAARPLDRPAVQASESAAEVAIARAAVAANADKDLAGYSVIQMVADVDDLRRGLGYDRINLIGQSFGSQWSLAVIRLHPEIVQRALLSGVEPLNNGYDMPSHVYAALQRVAWDADHDAALAPYLPRGGVMAAVRDVRDRLATHPVRVTVKEEKSGRPRTVVLGLGDFQRDLVRPAQAWPAWVISLYHGHYEAWAKAVIEARLETTSDEAMIGPLIDTSLGVTPAREHQLRTDPARDFLGAWNFDSYIAQAPVWPTEDIGDDLRTPVQSKVPVLFVHGDWDTSTPLENPLGLLPYFPNGRMLVIHRGEHSARAVAFEQQSPLFEAALVFLATGDASRVPAQADLPTPTFTRPDFVPPAAAHSLTAAR